MELKQRIEQVLSEILSDKYECEITLRFGNETQQKTYIQPTQDIA